MFYFVVIDFVMLITLEVLKEKRACSGGVQYFQSLEKKEWGVVELIKRCQEDCKPCLIISLYECIDSNDELRDIVGHYIKNNLSLRYIFEYCNKLFKNDLKLFEEAVRYSMKCELGSLSDDALLYCSECFKQLPELYKEVKLYQEEYWQEYSKM